ncbi:MAG: ABC transporter ATP-binding protein [Thermodesulfobacteriota bacterium]
MKVRILSIKLEQINFQYPQSTFGLFDVDFQLEPGELIAVIGASGSGKSTLLKIIAGFLRPDRGQVVISDRQVTHQPPKERNLGVVFQNYALFPHFQVWENVAYPLKVRGVNKLERRRQALDILGRLGLSEFVDRPIQTLSGGQQQRVALARALVFEPAALLLDEPLSALDASLRVETRDEIRRVQRELRISTLHITHDQEEALSMADRVAVMEAGRIVQIDTPQNLYDFPKSRSVAAFVGHANLFDAEIVSAAEIMTSFGRLAINPQSLAAGRKITILIRPERMETTESDQDRAFVSSSLNYFPCSIVRDRFLGAVRRFDALVNGVKLLGETNKRGPINGLMIPPENIQILP